LCIARDMVERPSSHMLQNRSLPDTDQSMIVYSTAPGTREAAALDTLRLTGTDRMGSLEQSGVLRSPWAEASRAGDATIDP
jgi:hypothetical protein